jgi:hypothetical protein
VDDVEGLQVLLELVAQRVVDVLQPPVVRDVGPRRSESRLKNMTLLGNQNGVAHFSKSKKTPDQRVNVNNTIICVFFTFQRKIGDFDEQHCFDSFC